MPFWKKAVFQTISEVIALSKVGQGHDLKMSIFDHWRHPNVFSGHYKQFLLRDLELDPVMLTLTFQGHKVKWQSYYLRGLLDPLICGLQIFLVWPWEIIVKAMT